MPAATHGPWTRRRVLTGGIAGLGAGLLGASMLGCARPCPCTETPQPTPPPLDTETHGDPSPEPDPTPEFAALAGLCDGLEPIAAPEYEARIERARAAMRSAKLDALVIEPGVDQLYFCGLQLWPNDRPVLLCLPVRGDPFIVTAAFELDTLVRRMGPLELPLRPWLPNQTPYEVAAAGLGESLKSGARVGVGPTTRLFVVEGLRRAAPRLGWHSGTDVIDGCRMRKSAQELALMRRANEATQRAIAAAAPHAREGDSERTFAAIVRRALEAAGLVDTWALVQFGESAAEPHGAPGDRSLREGDLILVDTGGSLQGYCSDISRTFAHGPIDDRRRKAWDAVLAAQSEALAAIRPGVRCAEVDAVARRRIGAAGFGEGYSVFTHRLGHGIGLQGHEHPYLGERSPHVLDTGMTMSDEPGIYVAGEFGVRIEDIVVVTDSGAEVFGQRPLSLEQPFG